MATYAKYSLAAQGLRLKPAARALRSLAVHDVVALGYLAVLIASLAVCAARATPALALRAALLLVAVAATAFGVRIDRSPSAAKVVAYRAALVGAILGSYLLLNEALPWLAPGTRDAELRALDLRLLGVDPVAALDPLVTPFWTEWFSFFYLSYFPLLLAVLIPCVLRGRDAEWCSELTLGLILVYAAGQTLYVLVPGYGPWLDADAPLRAFPGGFWHDHMMALVRAGGAQKDIFPSLHTAATVLLTIMFARHRAEPWLRWCWLPLAFITGNVLVATVFLRWHYVIDVFAGLALAILVALIAPPLVRWDAARRRSGRLPPLWPVFGHRNGTRVAPIS